MVKKMSAMLLLIMFTSLLFSIKIEDIPLIISHSVNSGGESEIIVNSNDFRKDVGDMELYYSAPAKRPSEVHINIYKRARVLELYGDDKLIGRFRIALGKAPVGDKNVEGDSKTPEGSYYICTRNEKSSYTLFLGLNYPNTDDARRGLSNNIINNEAYNSIKAADEHKQRPPWHTPLGGEVGIHGGGNDHDWTEGCIALSDKDILLIGKYATYRTPVNIYE